MTAVYKLLMTKFKLGILKILFVKFVLVRIKINKM